MVVAKTNNCMLSSPTSSSSSSSSSSSAAAAASSSPPPTNDIPLGVQDRTSSITSLDDIGPNYIPGLNIVGGAFVQPVQWPRPPPSYQNVLTGRLTPNVSDDDDIIELPPDTASITSTTIINTSSVRTNDVNGTNGGNGTTTGTAAVAAAAPPPPGTTIVIGPHGLPSYDEAIDPNSNIIAPPSYDSLFGRVRQARKQSNGIADFFKNILILLLGTLSCTIVLGITFVIPVSMFVFGMLYLNECPQAEYIPVYLLIGGFMGILKHLLHLSIRVRQPEEQAAEALRQSGTQTLINWFILGWFFIGSYWVYREYEPNYNRDLGKYCNKTLYLFSFWLITSIYMIVGILTMILILISVISVILMNRQNPINNINV